jgi:hypothetical protein
LKFESLKRGNARLPDNYNTHDRRVKRTSCEKENLLVARQDTMGENMRVGATVAPAAAEAMAAEKALAAKAERGGWTHEIFDLRPRQGCRS